MQQLLDDIDALCENWDVWSIVNSDVAKREASIQRSDEDKAIVTIRISASYPKGTISLSSNYGGQWSGSNKEVEEALDDALEKWVDEDAGDQMGAREGSSVLFDMAAAGGGANEFVSPEELERATAAVKADVTDSRLNGLAGFFFSDARKEFVVRVGIPLSSLEKFRANSLGLKRGLCFVVELNFHWKYVAGSDLAKVNAVFMCDAGEIGFQNPASRDDSVGALKWYFSQRVSDAIRKNHIIRDRKLRGLEEHDKTNSVEGLPVFKYNAEAFYKNGNENLLFGVQSMMKLRLEKCTSNCLICDEALEIDGMKTGICHRALCRHSLENYGIGTDVLSEITRSPEVAELLIYLTSASTSQGRSRDTFTPMCPVEIEGKTSIHYKGPLHFYKGKYGDDNNKDWELLQKTTQKIPCISRMVKMANGSTEELRKALNNEDPLVYPFLQWILASNRAHLEPLEPKQRINGMGNHQYHLISSNPEKERVFRERRAAMAAKNGGTGSFFVFHGSQPSNWHCILRGGLKNYSGTKYMSAGQAYGAGIYTARRMNISIGYMGSAYGAYKNAEHITHRSGCLLMALCEVVDDKKGYKDHGNDIVTIQDEDLVDTRFLFVFPDNFSGDGNVKADALNIPRDALQ